LRHDCSKSEKAGICAGLLAFAERKRIQQFYAQALHVAHVARNQDQVVDFRSGGYQRVYGGAWSAGARTRREGSANSSRLLGEEGDGQWMHSEDASHTAPRFLV